MQQLSIQQWLPTQGNYLAQCSVFPSQEGFVSWLKDLVPIEGLNLVDLSVGLDRAQGHLSFRNVDFVICFDGTCEAIWLEPMGKFTTIEIDDILVMLSR